LHNFENGRFQSKFDGFKEITFLDVLKWKFRTFGKRPHNTYKLESVDDSEKLRGSNDFICWLGHSSFIIQIDGKRIITDPVFGDVPLHKRLVDFPYKIEDLGEIDYILISHSHYDHLDLKSVELISQFSKSAKIVTPLNLSRYLKDIDLEIVELDWFGDLIDQDLKITFLPAKHWGRRGAFDLNRTLWGSFLINSIYFAGDTSYSEHFKEIGEKFKVDISLMPIGAYKPEEIMKSNHINPMEAVKGSLDLKTSKTIPMHYGTFRLSDEPLSEPIEWFQKEASRNSLDFNILKIGEVLFL
jgi:L-ascorbate metabolism protein UlaG (beta-lactamase superfamily)